MSSYFRSNIPSAPHSRKPVLLAGCAILLACSGCGRSGWQNDDTAPFTPNAAAAAPRTVDLGATTAPSPSDDPQLAHGGDNALTDTADPITSDQANSPDADSRLADGRSLGSAGTGTGGSKTQGWYWVVGRIQSGQIGISVNGTPIGRYSVHVDKEITAYCHPGLNTLTFTHYPLLGSGERVCETHLEIVNGNAAKGTPPVMVYDTAADGAVDRTADASAAATAATLPPDTGGDNVLSATGVDSSGNPDAAPGTDADSGETASAAPASAPSAPYSDLASFSGK